MILIAEDDKQVQKAYTRLLKNHELRIFDNAADALLAIDAGLKPDGIISDLDMPMMRGDTFCRALRDRGLATPFMLASGDIVVADLARECGADAWAVKGGDDMVMKITGFAQRATKGSGP